MAISRHTLFLGGLLSQKRRFFCYKYIYNRYSGLRRGKNCSSALLYQTYNEKKSHTTHYFFIISADFFRRLLLNHWSQIGSKIASTKKVHGKNIVGCNGGYGQKISTQTLLSLRVSWILRFCWNIFYGKPFASWVQSGAYH